MKAVTSKISTAAVHTSIFLRLPKTLALSKANLVDHTKNRQLSSATDCLVEYRMSALLTSLSSTWPHPNSDVGLEEEEY